MAIGSCPHEHTAGAIANGASWYRVDTAGVEPATPRTGIRRGHETAATIVRVISACQPRRYELLTKYQRSAWASSLTVPASTRTFA